MPGNWIFVVAWVVSIAFSGVVAIALLAYVRRTWQLIRSDDAGSAEERILDGLDEVQLRLSALSDRLERLESRLEAGERPPALDPPEGPDGS